MDRIFQRAEDKNVAAVILYASNTDDKVYLDKDCLNPVTAKQVTNAFTKGCFISYNDRLYTPLLCYTEVESLVGDVYKISIIDENGDLHIFSSSHQEESDSHQEESEP